MSVPENLNTYVTALLFVLGAYLLALYVGLVVWTFRDIRARSRDGLAHIVAPLLVALFSLPGLLIYVLVRPRTTLAEEYERSLAEEAILQDLDEERVCPSCRRHVEPDYLVCPACHQPLRVRCASCGRLLNPEWDVCPYCGLSREPTGPQEPALQAQRVGMEAYPPSRAASPRRAARRQADADLDLEQVDTRDFYAPTSDEPEAPARRE